MKDGYKLRHYQERSVLFTLDAFKEGKQSTIVVQPTGTGKTIVIAAVVEELVKEDRKVLILAHRNTLLRQAHDKLLKACGIDASYEGKPGGDDRVVISSVQGLSKDDRLNKHIPREFEMIIVDEVHHIESPSYKKITSFFEGSFIFGVTATPIRGDGVDVREFFDTVAPEYTRAEAVNEGFLCPVKIKKITIKVNISKVKLAGGDYAPGETAKILEKYLKKVAKEISIAAKGKKTIIFTPLVETAQILSECLKAEGIRADYVSGEKKNSEEVLEYLRVGMLDAVANSLLLTEGYDDPSIDCIVNLRPTRSETLFTQAIGRVLRTAPGKDYALILDLIWNDGGRGHLRPTDILIEEKDFFIRDAMDLVLSCGEEMTVEEVHEKATVLGEEIKKEKIAALMEEKQKAIENRQIEQERISQIKQEVREYGLRKAEETHKPFESICGVVRFSPTSPLMMKYRCCSGRIEEAKVKDETLSVLGLGVWKSTLGNEWEQRQPSEDQLKMLDFLGIPKEFVACSGHAAYLLNELKRRQNERKASYKQVKILSRYKIEDPSSYSSKEAKVVIDTIAKNGWKPVNVSRSL